MAEPRDDVDNETAPQPAASRDTGRTPDDDAERREQDGYFDSSMGYASEGSVSGNLNPFPYRGPGARKEKIEPDTKMPAE